MSSRENNTCIHIQTLGGLTISIGSKTISNHSQQARKPWTLLEYLITFRDKNISAAELIETFWGDDDSANPAGSLKTLLFRSRKLLEPLGIPTQKLIVQQQGSYAWTKEYEVELDTERFDQLCKIVLSPDEDLEACKAAGFEAADLYKGDFLPQSSWEAWAIPINTYYHSLYLKMAHRLLEICFREEAYESIVSLCRRAITIEAFDEDFHYYLIHALYRMDNSHAALEHYTHMTDMFYNEFAITPSDKLKDLYKIIQDNAGQTETDLTVIQTRFQNTNSQYGAFFCEYTVFKDIYLLESRAIDRTGDSIYLCLFNIINQSGDTLTPSRLNRIMKDLLDSILASLRRGDVCSRFSASQYILLLPSSTYENGDKVMRRILQNFNGGHTYKNIQVTYSLQAITPLKQR